MRSKPEEIEDSEDSVYFSPPVQRAAKLLRYIATGGTIANLQQAVKTLSISRTTMLRLLYTLEIERFISKVPETGEYQIGVGLLGLVGQNAYGQDLVQVALPSVGWLAEQSGLSAHLGVLDGTDVVYLARRIPNVPLASNIRVGSRLSAHATTLGRAILAFMEPETVRTMYKDRPLDQHTDRTPTTVSELLEKLKAEFHDGYSSSDGMLTKGVSSIAAPIFGESAQVLASINVTGPTELVSASAERRAHIVALVLQAAHTISLKLGYRPGSAVT